MHIVSVLFGGMHTHIYIYTLINIYIYVNIHKHKSPLSLLGSGWPMQRTGIETGQSQWERRVRSWGDPPADLEGDMGKLPENTVYICSKQVHLATQTM